MLAISWLVNERNTTEPQYIDFTLLAINFHHLLIGIQVSAKIGFNLVGLIDFALTSGVTAAAVSKDLDALLKQVKEGTIKDTKENKARENEFKKNKARQAQLIQQAKAERARLEKISEQLEATFEANQAQQNTQH